MTFQGSCSDMCPEAERQFRFGPSLSIFERDKDNNPDEYAMVKEYRRSSADQKDPEPSDLRTPEALSRTMDYLVCNIMDDPRSSTKELALDWYDFLWDRLRAIRKDITQQNICDQASAILVERCARFHVHCCYAMNKVKNFDVDMNKRNLNDCLQMLRQMYSDLRMTQGIMCPGELEFQLYDILLHLNDDQLASTVLMKTSDYRSTNKMKSIISIVIAHSNNDYHKFFQLMKSANYMTSCILSLYATRMRLLGLKSIINACPPRQNTSYPLDLAVKLLGFDDGDDLKLFLANLGIEVHEKDGNTFLSLNRDLIQLLRTKELESQCPFKSKHLVEDKANCLPVGLLVDGRDQLPQNPYRAIPQQEVDIASEDEEDEEEGNEEEGNEEEEKDEEEEEEQEEEEEEESLRRESEMKARREEIADFMPVTSEDEEQAGEVEDEEKEEDILRRKLEMIARREEITEFMPLASDEEEQEEEGDKEEEEEEEEEEILRRKLEMIARREEIADFMPVGRYKVRDLKTKAPTLRPPSLTNGHTIPLKRSKPTSSAQRIYESMRREIDDEARTNENFHQFVDSLRTI